MYYIRQEFSHMVSYVAIVDDDVCELLSEGNNEEANTCELKWECGANRVGLPFYVRNTNIVNSNK